MAKSRISRMDTLDDRREIWKALHCVTPEQRVRILAYLSASVGGFFGRGVTVKDETWEKATWADRVYGASVNLTNEVYRDIWLLVSNYSLDPLVMGNTVIEFARKPHTIPPKKHFLSNGETVSKR